MQDCSNSIAKAMELQQSSTKPWIWTWNYDKDVLQSQRISMFSISCHTRLWCNMTQTEYQHWLRNYLHPMWCNNHRQAIYHIVWIYCITPPLHEYPQSRPVQYWLQFQLDVWLSQAKQMSTCPVNGLVLLIRKLDSTRCKASETCLRPPLDIYSHTFSI